MQLHTHRVSTTEQKTIGNSLLSQKTKIRSFCDKHGINILKNLKMEIIEPLN